MYQEEIQEKIEDIEQQIRSLPYHKGTEHHIGKLKAKLAKLRGTFFAKTPAGGGGERFTTKKQGDATVVFVGMPSVGKSTLLNKLTSAESKTGSYPFTTLTVIPGTLKYKGADIQIFDVPGLIKGASKGRGGGKQILSVVRVADLLVLIASAEDPSAFKTMDEELHKAGVRINQVRPQILVQKRVRGGIEISGISGLSKELVMNLAREFRIMNAKITFNQRVSQDQLIDALMGNRVYVPCLRILSKSDLLSQKEKSTLEKEYPDALFISSLKNINIEKLKQALFGKLHLIRIFLKEGSGEPLICRRGTNVKETAEKVSQALANEIKGARITGPSALFDNQQVGMKHKLKDGDRIVFVK